MAHFVGTTEFVVLTCCNCGMQFAMTADFRRRRLDDRKWFYCPAGHSQVFTGATEAQRLREQLERAQASAAVARRERDQISKAHRRMRQRVANGVCPCCNRSFENLRNHMHTQHPDYGQEKTLRALRIAFGMTQEALAREAGVTAPQVSMFENNRPVSAEARTRLEWWLENQHAA